MSAISSKGVLKDPGIYNNSKEMMEVDRKDSTGILLRRPPDTHTSPEQSGRLLWYRVQGFKENIGDLIGTTEWKANKIRLIVACTGPQKI